MMTDHNEIKLIGLINHWFVLAGMIKWQGMRSLSLWSSAKDHTIDSFEQLYTIQQQSRFQYLINAYQNCLSSKFFVYKLENMKADDQMLIVQQIKKAVNQDHTKLELPRQYHWYKDQINHYKCKVLVSFQWPLQLLNLSKNLIDHFSCKQLSKGKWHYLQSLNLSFNLVGPQGCKQLCKGQWPCLQSLNLQSNEIGHKGCKELIKGPWMRIKELNLNNNQIGSEGCHFLVQKQWPGLLSYSLRNFSQQLDPNQSECPAFQCLSLQNNNIGCQGCNKLAQAQWLTLRRLYLNKNGIQDKGCQYLSGGQWPVLQLLSVDQNEISNLGCEYLSEGKWPLLKQLRMDKEKLITSFRFVHNLKPFENSLDLPFYNILIIDFQNNAIDRIQSLTRLTAPFLQKLIASNKITNLNGLFKLHSRQLRELNLKNNKLNQLNGISTMNISQLQILQIIEYKVFSMRPLLKCELKRHQQILKGYYERVSSKAFERKFKKSK